MTECNFDAMTYRLRKQTKFQTPSEHSVFSGTEIIKFFGPKTFGILPHEMN